MKSDLQISPYFKITNRTESGNEMEFSSSKLFLDTGFAQSCDSSVGVALGCGLDDRDSTFRFLAGAENFSLRHRVQNGSGAHPTHYPMGIKGSFPGCKAADAWSWLLISI
jgi:hypothetical protein